MQALRRPLAAVVLLAAWSSACASSGGVRPRPFPTAGTSSVPLEAVPVDSALVATALQLRGVPYQNGGSSPAGFDCSGFTQFVFAQHGMRIPREVREQFAAGRPVGDHVEAGDLIFFATTSKAPSHVGILIGGEEFVHAPSSRGVVRVERFTAPYWAQRLVGVRRLGTLPAGSAASHHGGAP